MIPMRSFISVFLLFLIGGGVWVALNLEDLKILRQTASAYYAKEICTCTFVLEKDEGFCRAYTVQFLPLDHLEVVREGENPYVVAKAVGIEKKAQYIGERFGCRLVETVAVRD